MKGAPVGLLKTTFLCCFKVPYTITCLLLLLLFNISTHFSLSFSEFFISLHLFVTWSDIIFHPTNPIPFPL